MIVLSDPDDVHLATIMLSTRVEADRRRDRRQVEGRLLRQRLAALLIRTGTQAGDPGIIDCVPAGGAGASSR